MFDIEKAREKKEGSKINEGSYILLMWNLQLYDRMVFMGCYSF